MPAGLSWARALSPIFLAILGLVAFAPTTAAIHPQLPGGAEVDSRNLACQTLGDANCRPVDHEYAVYEEGDRVGVREVDQASSPQPESAAKAAAHGETLRQVLEHPATWTLGLLLVLFGLYHRVHGPRVLHHPLRQSILRRAQERPGILATEIARAEGVTLNAVLHHVRVLEREDHLRVQRVGRSGLLFPKTVPPAHRASRAALRAPLALALLRFAADRPEGRTREAAASLGASERGVRTQLVRLARNGLVERDPARPRARFRITLAGQAALAEVAPIPWVAPVPAPGVAPAAA